MNETDVCLEPGKAMSNPETKRRIAEVARRISKGWTKFETKKWIEKEWGVKETSSNRYWNAAISLLAVQTNNPEYVAEMRDKTIATAERLIQTEIEEGRYKEANSTMDLLSRLLGYNVAKSEIKLDGNVKFAFGDIPSNESEKEEEEEGENDK